MQPTQYGYPAPAGFAPQPGQPYAPPVQQYPAPPSYGPPAGQYPTPGYGMPAAPAVQPTVPGSIDDFYGQQSTGSGPSFKFKDANGLPHIGKSYVGVVARTPNDGDVRQATDNNGVPQFHRGGKPKYILIVPMLVPASQEFPEGVAGWWVKGQARDELVKAMAAAGAPVGPPEAGAIIRVTLTGTRPVPNMNPQFLYRIEYQRPIGDPETTVQMLATQLGQAAPVAQPQYAPPAQYAPPPAQQVAAAPQQQYAPQGQGAPAQPVYGVMGTPEPQRQGTPEPQWQGGAVPATAYAAPVPAAQAMQAVAAGQPAPAIPVQPQPAQAAPVPGLSAGNAALMATLLGQQQPAPVA